MVETPAILPTRLRAGDTWQWRRTIDGYPASTWTLKTYFRSDADLEPRVVTAVASGDDYAITVAAADSAVYPPGRYRFVERVDALGIVKTITAGDVTILADFANLANDDRTWAQRCLAAIKAVMENRANTDQASMTIDDTALSRMGWQELNDQYLRFKRIVDRERGIDVDKVRVRL